MPAYVEQYQCELRLPVYLTFDDGPHLRVTRRILQVLREERAKATFFIVGNRLKEPGALEIVAQAIAEGHTIGNHSLTHCDLTLFSERDITTEVVTTSKLLEPLGVACTLVRPPYGRTNNVVAKVIEELGYQLVLWNNDPRDWARESQPDKWVDAVVAAVHERNARVILCHDIHETTADHLGCLIKRLSREGYYFATWGETGKEAGGLGQVLQ